MILNSKISESPTLMFGEAVNARKQRGEKIISLGLGEPDFSPPKVLLEKLNEVAFDGVSNKYSSPLGLPGLREKVAQSFKDENNINCSSENTIITPGTKQAVMLSLMALLEPGDEVIVILPAYVSYIPQIYIAESTAKVVTVDLDKNTYNLDLDRIKKSITQRTKAIIINTPHNPTGVMIPESDIKKIYEMAVENNFYVITDEIYEKLDFGNISHYSIGELEEKITNVITVSGFGKTHAITGWRIGYACIPQKLMKKINKLQQHINTNTSTLIQKAIDSTWPLPTNHIEEYKKKLKSRTDEYLKFIEANNYLSGSKPEGGIFAFFNIGSVGIDSTLFASKLVDQTGVAISPGIAFGDNWDDHLRLSLAVDNTLLSKSLNIISEFIKLEQWK